MYFIQKLFFFFLVGKTQFVGAKYILICGVEVQTPDTLFIYIITRLLDKFFFKE